MIAENAMDYRAMNRQVFDAIPRSARRILDLGCGTGSLGRAIKDRQDSHVTGITWSTSEAEEARSLLDRVIVSDLNGLSTDGLERYDCIICSHVLEHLYWPEVVLKSIRPLLEPGGRLVVALPNILHWRQRLCLLRGEFRYTSGGLMDRTHFRFFDWWSAKALVAGAGFREVSASSDGGIPLARFLPAVGRLFSHMALRAAPGLFGWQFIIVAEPAVGSTL